MSEQSKEMIVECSRNWPALWAAMSGYPYLVQYPPCRRVRHLRDRADSGISARGRAVYNYHDLLGNLAWMGGDCRVITIMPNQHRFPPAWVHVMVEKPIAVHARMPVK
jgi:hypothetical protein